MGVHPFRAIPDMTHPSPCDGATLYVTQGSGNSFKPALVLAQLGVPHRLRHVDVVAGEARSPAYRAVNRAGQVPFLVDARGFELSESDAILWYAAEGSHLVPADPAGRATVLRWMLIEQTRLEPNISPARFYSTIVPERGRAFAAEIPRWRARAVEGLSMLDDFLSTSRFIARSHGYSIGDIAVFGYVHLAGEAGIDLGAFPNVSRWIRRVEATPGFRPIGQLLRPMPDQAGRLAG